MSPKVIFLVTAILSTVLPVVAVILRGRSQRMLMASTLLTATALSAIFAVILKLKTMAPQYEANDWVHGLVALPILLLLAGYLFSLSFGREGAAKSLADSRRTLIYLAVAGIAMLVLQRNEAFLTKYFWYGQAEIMQFGYIGKIYLSYLLIGIVLIGHNLEKTYRVSSSEHRARIRPSILAIYAVLLYFTFILSTGLLYSWIGMGRLIAAGIPVAAAGVLVAHGFLRGAISDSSAPVSRSFVYTSFTALTAGLFVLSIAVAAQLAALTNWSPDEILIFAFGFLALLMAALLAVSNRFQRRVRRFIDRNFYVNRYDYRTQWSRLTAALEDATGRDTILDRVSGLLAEVFSAEEVTIALRDEATHQIRPVRGKGTGDPSLALPPDTPLVDRLLRERKALILDGNPTDFAYVGIYAENQAWLDATAGRMVAPLINGSELIGTIGLLRGSEDDRFTFEDASLLDSICMHVATELHNFRLASELAEAREMELISQWSSMTLHDLKNHLTPLRLAASNLARSKDDPEVVEACSASISRVADRMERLVQTLGEFRAASHVSLRPVDLNEVVMDALNGLQVESRPGLDVVLSLEAERDVMADPAMLRRVIENLVTNAIEAMNGSGLLRLATSEDTGEGSRRVYITVSDSGHGMTGEFLRERLFRPFATTREKGLGLGLWQCRMIIQAHGGEITAESRPGEGAVFNIALGGAVDASTPQGAAGRRIEAPGRVANEVASESQ